MILSTAVLINVASPHPEQSDGAGGGNATPLEAWQRSSSRLNSC
jgi:hypothetical protein